MTRGYYRALDGIGHRALRGIATLTAIGEVSSASLLVESGTPLKEGNRILNILKDHEILTRVRPGVYVITSSGKRKLPKLVEQARKPVKEDSA